MPQDGVWDEKVKSLGPYAFAHTNLTEIDTALNLLWRNNVNPERVVMGLGFYGRSKTALASISRNLPLIIQQASQ